MMNRKSCAVFLLIIVILLLYVDKSCTHACGENILGGIQQGSASGE